MAAADCIDPMQMQVEYGTMAFVQTRHLSGVRAPLVARGRAQIAPQRVDWRVTEPVNVVTTITPAGLTQSVDGAAPQRVGPTSDAFLSSAGLLSLLTGDLDSLTASYQVARQPNAASGHWRVRLTPRAAQMAQFLSYLEVAGCERLASVEVRQANGDWMEIALSPPER